MFKNCFVNMGKPYFDWSVIPLSKQFENQIIKIDEFELFCVSMGNPHAVIFFKDLNELNKIDIEKIGIKIQKSDKSIKREYSSKINGVFKK